MQTPDVKALPPGFYFDITPAQYSDSSTNLLHRLMSQKLCCYYDYFS